MWGPTTRECRRKTSLLSLFSHPVFIFLACSNPDAKTIEDELFKALTSVGAVSEANSVDQKKVQLMRAARTDKGVHALGQVISVKLLLRPNLLRLVNEALPADIRVFDIQRVAGSFDARMSCESRVYEYTMPTYIFAEGVPPPLTPELAEWVAKHDVPGPRESQQQRAREKIVQSGGIFKVVEMPNDSAEPEAKRTNSGAKRIPPKAASESSVGGNVTEGEDEEEEEDEEEFQASSRQRKEKIAVDLDEPFEVQREREGFRLGGERLARIRELFKLYQGTKNYHNFTSGRSPQDKSCQRYLMSLTVEDPRLIGGTEWVTIKIHGQSFMLHQIRKMIGLVVAVTKTRSDPSVFERCFTQEKLHIPIVPGTGLFLSHPMYPTYNKRVIQLMQEPLTLRRAEVSFLLSPPFGPPPIPPRFLSL